MRLSRRRVEATAFGVVATALGASAVGLLLLDDEPALPAVRGPVVVLADLAPRGARPAPARGGTARAGDGARPRAGGGAGADGGAAADLAANGAPGAGGPGAGGPGAGAGAPGEAPGPGDAGRQAASAAAAAPATQGRLTGLVVDPEQRPLGNVAVVAESRERARRGRPAPEPLRGVTDGLGRFVLADVPPGRWALRAEVERSVSTREEVDVKPGAEARARPLVVTPAPCALAGRVTTADGRPVAGALVTAERGRGGSRVRRRATTGKDGAALVEGLPEGLWAVTAEAEGFVAARQDQVPVTTARGGEATFTLQAAARGEGTLRGPDGAPAAKAELRLLRGRDTLARPRTDDAGRFVVEGLAPGPIELLARSADGRLSARLAAELVAGRVVPLDLALAAGPSVTGRVVTTTGAPRPGARVTATSVARRARELRRTARADDQGRFEVADLVPGRYVLTIDRRGAPPLARASVDVSTGPAVCDLVVVEGGSILGVVLGPGGAPLAQANVFAIVQGRERSRARTDAAGAFALRGLSAAAVRVLARGPGDALVAEATVQVAEDAVVDGLRLEARPPARLLGRVVDPDGRPLEGISLLVRGLEAPVRRRAATDAAGRFEVAVLYDGAYRVDADEGPLRLLARRRGVERVVVAGWAFAVQAGRDVACELRSADERTSQ